MCLGSFKFWKRHQKKPDESSFTHRPPGLSQPEITYVANTTPKAATTLNVAPGLPAPASATNPQTASDCPVTPTTAVEPTQVSTPAESSSQPSPKLPQPREVSRQVELWNRAYNEVRSREPELVGAYEYLLSADKNNIDEISHGKTPGLATPPQERWDQMRNAVQAGLSKTERSTAIQEDVHGLIQAFDPVVEMMNQIVQVVPQAAVAWVPISLVYQPSINREGLVYVISRMKWHMELTNRFLDDSSTQQQAQFLCQLEDNTVELYQKLLLYVIKSVYCFHKNGLERFLRNVIKVDDWSNQINDIKAAEADVSKVLGEFQSQATVDYLKEQSVGAQKTYEEFQHLASLIHRQIQQQEDIKQENDNRECRRLLRQTDPALDKERILIAKGTLLQESYGWVIDHPRFRDWKQNPQSRRLWIKGGPGKGKTMLLCGIIEELERDPFCRLCYFFCQATEEKLRDAKAVLRGLMFHLVKQYPWLISYVRKEYDDSGERLFNDQNTWIALGKIFRSMLSDESLHEVIIIVDGLDECLVERASLLKFIHDISAGSRAKLIVSSRDYPDIQRYLRGDDEGATTLPLELNEPLISDAVNKFIDRRVEALAKDPPYKGEPELCDKITKHLKKNANNTFLWVALVCQELSTSSVLWESHVDEVLDKYPPGLDELYNRMLDSIRELRDATLCTDILAANSVVNRPVTLQELLSIVEPSTRSKFDLPKLEQIIGWCGSFLHLQNGVVYFIHQSAVDFLQKENSSRLPSIENRHHSVFRNSLRALHTSDALKRDMYNLKNPAITETEIKVPKDNRLASYRYSCIYWVDHLCDHMSRKRKLDESDTIRAEDASEVYCFLKSKFLFWIEALNILGNMPQAVQAIQKLQRLVSGKINPADQALSEFIHDANRFLLYHKVMIEKYPLQLYAAALVFSPQQSLVKRQFRAEAPNWVKIGPGLKSTWDSCLQTMEDHESGVQTVAYSPDGQWLASGSLDGTAKLWDAETGTCLHTVGGHGGGFKKYSTEKRSACIMSVAFSVNGESFVTGSSNGIVKVWDRASGNFIQEHQAHSTDATAMAISSDSCTVASVIPGNIISTWSTKTEIPSRTFENLKEHVQSVALSADGQWVAAAVPHEVTICNMLTGEREELPANFRASTVTWSADAQWVAAGGGEMVQISERQSGETILKTKFQSTIEPPPSVETLALSADKKLLAAGGLYHICVWNTTTSALIWEMGGSTSNINSICFSPDAQRLVSGSKPHTIKVWDLSKPEEIVSQHYSHTPLHVCCSDENHFMAYYPGVEEILLWGGSSDVPDSRFLQGRVSTISLSQDNQQVASGSWSDTTITIWDTRTGDIARTFSGDTKESSSDNHGRSQGQDQQMNFDMSSASPIQPRRRRRSIRPYVCSMAFGNKFQLASSVTGSISIWNTSDGTHVQTLDDGDDNIYLMSFSNDGRWLAFSSSDTDQDNVMIKIWDTETKQCISTSKLPASNHRINTLSFSSNSQLLAFASCARMEGVYPAKFRAEIHVWDVKSGALLRKFESYKVDNVRAWFDSKLERRLHTEHGFFDITGCLDFNHPVPDCSDSGVVEGVYGNARISGPVERLASFHGYGLSYDLEWIVLNGDHLI
ncbi:hypothetical protein ACHAPJ_006282 [Fusarium lateritium]